MRDLVPKEGAVDPDNDFAMKYQVIERNEKHVNAIIRALKKADALYLATDPDREGEAISWHLIELLKERGALDDKDVHRVVFHEITKQAVQDAVAIRASCPATWWARSRRAGRSTTWWASTCRRCCGRRSSPAVCRPRAKPGAAHDRRARTRD